jgi:hypothetical protein
MAACIVGSLFAQETLDSLSYAMGDEYIRHSDLNLSGMISQSVNDREEFVQGFSDGLKRTAATSYHDGQRMGFYVLIADDVKLPLGCLLEGVRKVADNTVVLPRDTIGAYQLFNGYGVKALPMVDGGDCRLATMMGILCGLSAFVPDRLMSDSITIEDQQAFAAGMADVLEMSDSMAAYDTGKLAVAFFFPDVMIMKKNRDLDLVDYDAIIDGVRGAMELTERKMSVEEVEMCLTQYYAAQYNIQAAEELGYNDDFDDVIIEEEAVKEALYDFEVDGIYYLINGNEATVTNKAGNSLKNPCYSGELAIPTTVTYNGVTYSVTSIGSHAFAGCRGLASVNIPNSVTSIGNEAFSHCRGLSSVTIPNSVTSVGEWAFNECYSLTGIEIPNSVTSIGYAAFCKSGLTSIIIPNSVTTIDEYAFSDCSELTSVSIGNSVSLIDDWAFQGCSGLTSIVVVSGNPTYDSRNNCNAIIETTSNKLILGCMNTTIPNSVTAIDEYAFSGCSGLTSIDIPNSVTTIGGSAFSSCSDLTNVTIPKSVTTIGHTAFSHCSGLKDVYSYIDNLSLVSMGSLVFYVNPANYKERTLHVPVGTSEAYQADTNWSQYFGNIVEMEP